MIFLLPKHKGELSIYHNSHKTYYQTVGEYVGDGTFDPEGWASVDEKTNAIATNEMWTIQWYPLTPVGFYSVSASTFEAAIKAALAIDADINGTPP